MSRRTTLLAAVALFAAISVAQAHLPPDETFGAFQWPTNQLPVLDGNISEWDALPAELWVDSNDFGTTQSIAEVNPADFFFRVAVGWNDELERIYFASERFDDVYDRNGDSRDDTFEFGWDADHSAGDFWRGDLTEEAEIWRNRGSTGAERPLCMAGDRRRRRPGQLVLVLDDGPRARRPLGLG